MATVSQPLGGPVNLPVNAPFSGPVTQAISPWMAYFPMFGSQVGSYTVNVGTSSNPATEKAVLNVASYGKQLGRIEALLLLLLKHVNLQKLSDEEAAALGLLRQMQMPNDSQPLRDFQYMLAGIADAKASHG